MTSRTRVNFLHSGNDCQSVFLVVTFREWWLPRWASRRGLQPNLAVVLMAWLSAAEGHHHRRLPLHRPIHPSSRPPKVGSWPDGWSKGSGDNNSGETKTRGMKESRNTLPLDIARWRNCGWIRHFWLLYFFMCHHPTEASWPKYARPGEMFCINQCFGLVLCLFCVAESLELFLETYHQLRS